MHSKSEPSNFAAIKAPLSQEAFDQLFREARTHHVASRTCARRAPAQGLRIGASGADQRQRLASQVRFSNYARR